MRNFYFLVLSLIGLMGYAQIVNIPDPNFKSYCLANFDTNNDGEIQVSEIEQESYLNLNGQSIFQLNGIEAFTNLTRLEISNNFITNLDISQNTLLQQLIANDNRIQNLDLSQNIQLKNLYLSRNRISSIDISNLSNLETIYINENRITSLNVSSNPNLKEININSNRITSLDVTQNLLLTHIQANNNLITDVDFSANIFLSQLYLNNNPIAEIDLTNKVYLISLLLDNTNIDSVSLLGAPNLETLHLRNLGLQTIDISNNLYLKYLRLENNNLTHLDVSEHWDLTSLDIKYNNLTSLNLKNGNNHVMNVYCNGNNYDLQCIQVDDENASYLDSWGKPSSAYYSENCNYEVPIDATLPVALTQDITVELDANGMATITAEDINNGSSDDVTATENLILSLDITSFDCSDVGENTVILTVTDGSGNSSTATSIVTVEDNLAPEVDAQDITVDLAGNSSVSIVASDVATATDNCGVASITLSEDTFTEVGVYTISVVVTDDNGNSVTETVIITVVENTLGVKDTQTSYDLQLYPNPTSDYIYIKASFEVELIQVYDLSGRLIKTTKNNYIDMKGSISGIYIVRIISNNGNVYNDNIMVK